MYNIPISKPSLGEAEVEAVSAVIRSGMIAQGAQVAAFEEAFAAYIGADHAIATTNGTTALTVALMAAGVGAGDEVIIPSFSFFATASAILSVGAKPVFADIEPQSFNLDPRAVEGAITPRTKAIMPVHLYGQAADLPAFEALCVKHGLTLLEDAAQSHGAKFNDRGVGSWGVAGFSFYPSKNMTTGEGGIVTTNDAKIAERAHMVRNHGMSQQYRHEMIGFNFRMTDIMGAIGRVQLERLPEWTAKRQTHAAYYSANLRGVTVPPITEGASHVFHQYTIRVPQEIKRDEVLAQIQAKGIGARVYYPLPIHQQPVFRAMGDYAGLNLPETERATQEVISLPVYPGLSEDERAYVVQTLNEVIASC